MRRPLSAAVLVLSLAVPSALRAQDESETSAPGLSCNRGALTAKEWKRHDAATSRLLLASPKIDELESGWAFREKSDAATLRQLAEWIADERQCCPFLRFAIVVNPGNEGTTLEITGAPGVKDMLREALLLKSKVPATSPAPSSTPPAAPKTSTHDTVALRWADVEPAARTCYSLGRNEGDYGAAPDASHLSDDAMRLPESVRNAVMAGCEDAVWHVMFTFDAAQKAGAREAKTSGLAAGTAKFREQFYSDAHAERMLRKSVTGALNEAAMACADCAAPSLPARQVAFADFVPYIVRLCYLAPDDIGSDHSVQGFHVCTCKNDLKGLPEVDTVLASATYAALVRTFGEDEAMRNLVKEHAKVPCSNASLPVTKDTLAIANADLQVRLSADAKFLAGLHPVLAAEVRDADLDCSDCGPPEQD